METGTHLCPSCKGIFIIFHTETAELKVQGPIQVR